MPRRRLAVLSLLVGGPECVCAPGAAGPSAAPATPATVLSPDRVIVRWLPGADHGAGTVATGTVALTLGPKPKQHRH